MSNTPGHADDHPDDHAGGIGEPHELLIQPLIGSLCAAAAAGRVVNQRLQPYPADEAVMRMCFARFLTQPRTWNVVAARLAAGDTVCLADPLTLAEEGIPLHPGDRLHLKGGADIRISATTKPNTSAPLQHGIGEHSSQAEPEDGVIQFDAATSVHLILADGRNVYPITSAGALLLFRACHGKTRLLVMTRAPLPQSDVSGGDNGQWWGH